MANICWCQIPGRMPGHTHVISTDPCGSGGEVETIIIPILWMGKWGSEGISGLPWPLHQKQWSWDPLWLSRSKATGAAFQVEV